MKKLLVFSFLFFLGITPFSCMNAMMLTQSQLMQMTEEQQMAYMLRLSAQQEQQRIEQQRQEEELQRAIRESERSFQEEQRRKQIKQWIIQIQKEHLASVLQQFNLSNGTKKAFQTTLLQKAKERGVFNKWNCKRQTLFTAPETLINCSLVDITFEMIQAVVAEYLGEIGERLIVIGNEIVREEQQRQEKQALLAQTSLAEYLLQNMPPRCLTYKIGDAMAIQLPTVQQGANMCGSHALVNGEILAANLTDFPAIINLLTDNELIQNMVNEVATRVQQERNDYFSGAWLSQENPGDGVNIDAVEMITSNGSPAKQYSGSRIYRTIAGFAFNNPSFIEDVSIKDAVRRFKKNQRPEVLVINTGGHWITVRIERMSNGVLAILLADSAWNVEGSVADKINHYEHYLQMFSRLAAMFDGQ